MDLAYIFASLVLQALVPVLRALLWLVLLPLKKILIQEEALVRALNQRIANTGRSSLSQYVGLAVTPAEGYHLFTFDGHWVFAERFYVTSNSMRSPAYQLYSFYSFADLPHRLLAGSGAFEIWFEPSANVWQMQFPEMRCVPLPSETPLGWQKRTIDKLLEAYQNNTGSGYRDHASALVWGQTGMGKSSLAAYLAQSMQEKLGVHPVIVRGFNPTISGITFAVLENITVRTAHTPLIIVLDELDTMAAYCLKDRAGMQNVCYAQDKSSFCSFRDRLDTLQHVIVIATTNIEPPTSGEMLPFYREKSFPIRVHAKKTKAELRSS